MEECRQYKEEMGILYEEIKEHQFIHSEQNAEVIKLKFECEHLLESHKTLNARLTGIQGMLMQMKKHLALQIEGQQTMLSEKAVLENKILSFQESLVREVEKFEELHFKQNE